EMSSAHALAYGTSQPPGPKPSPPATDELSAKLAQLKEDKTIYEAAAEQLRQRLPELRTNAFKAALDAVMPWHKEFRIAFVRALFALRVWSWVEFDFLDQLL